MKAHIKFRNGRWHCQLKLYGGTGHTPQQAWHDMVVSALYREAVRINPEPSKETA